MFFVVISGFVKAQSMEIKASYFMPAEKSFQDIYGNGWMPGLAFHIKILKDFDLELDVNYLFKSGNLTIIEEDTRLSILPIGVGIRYRLLTGKLNLYSVPAIKIFYYRESNLIGVASKWGVGYGFKIGSFIRITKNLFFDFYSEYTYCKMKPDYFKINIGGVNIAWGLIYGF